MRKQNAVERMLDGAIKREVPKEDIETVESMIPICQGRDNYASAAADQAERISK